MLTSVEVRGEVGVECGGLGGDPPAASGGTDADQGDRSGGGVFEEHGEEGVGRRGSASVSASGGEFGGGSGGAADPGVAAGLPNDAGHGYRGTHCLAVLDTHLEHTGGRAAADLCAAGSSVAHHLSGGGDRP